MSSWTSTDLANLEEAIAQGITSCTIAGKTVQYRSLDEMMRIRAAMLADLGLSTADKRKRVTYASFSRK